MMPILESIEKEISGFSFFESKFNLFLMDVKVKGQEIMEI